MTDKNTLILITGATGAVGPLVVKEFHDAGYSIRTLSIDLPPVGIWPDDVADQIGDITDMAAVQAAMAGVEVVIHLAALLHILNPTPALREKYERINVGGTAMVVDAAIRAGVRRILFFSTIAVYGPAGGRIINEDTPPQPDTFYAQTKYNAEKIVLNARRPDGGALGSVLRLGAVYGTRIKGNYQRLLNSLSRGRFLPIGDGSNRRTLVYEKDVARVAVLAAAHEAAAGRIYNVSDGCCHSMNEIISAICDALGRKSPAFSLPVAPARLAAGFLEDAARILGRRSPMDRSTIDKYTEDIAVDSRRIQTELGFVPRYDLAAGWKETVDEMRKKGEI